MVCSKTAILWIEQQQLELPLFGENFFAVAAVRTSFGQNLLVPKESSDSGTPASATSPNKGKAWAQEPQNDFILMCIVCRQKCLLT